MGTSAAKQAAEKSKTDANSVPQGLKPSSKRHVTARLKPCPSSRESLPSGSQKESAGQTVLAARGIDEIQQTGPARLNRLRKNQGPAQIAYPMG
jgi:hypothetical protein